MPDKYKILNQMTWEAIYFFLLLLGLFPAIAENSLFQWTTFSKLDFLYGSLIQPSKLLYLLPIVLLPIGLYLFFKKRKFWMLVGLLPSIFTLIAILLSKFPILLDINLFSYLLFFAYKTALIVFMVKGHIRSISFFTILISAFFLLPWKLVLLFAFFVSLLRIIFLAIAQNVEILAGVSKKKLAGLFLKTLLAWSPILLFAVPGYLISSKITKEAQQAVYDHTLVTTHAKYTSKRMKHIMKYSVKENLDAVGLDHTGHEKSQEMLNTVLQVIQFRLDSLQYTDYMEGVNDFKELFTLYQKKFNPQSSRVSTVFLTNHVSQDLEKVLIKRFLAGRDAFQLDIDLSLHEFYSKQQINAKREADSLNANFKGAIENRIRDNQKKMAEIIVKSEELEREIQEGIGQNRAALIEKTRQLADHTRKETNQSIDEVHGSMKSDIDAFPNKANAAFATAVPQKLTDVNSGFALKDCRFFGIKCKAVNLIKDLLIDSYASQRESSRKGVDRRSKALRDDANQKLDRATNATKEKIDASLKASEEKTNQVVDSGAGTASKTTQEALIESNQRIRASVQAVSDELKATKKRSEEMNRKSHEEIERSVATAKNITRNTLMSLYQGIFFFNVFSNIMLLMLVIKSFLYVFSRIAFSEKNNIHIKFRNSFKTYENGILKKCGSEYSIPADFPEKMYIVRKYFPSGRAPKVAVPLWTNSIGARIRSGTYVMNQIVPRKDAEESVDFRSIKGAEFVEWNLSDGEEVVFNYEDLVAFSESVQLSSFVSLRITSMFLGKSIFRVATGPGKLVLMTHGKPMINQGAAKEKITKSVPIERIIAWQKTTQFSVDSELSIADIYFSDLYLKRTNEDLMIIDADPGNIKRQVGLVRFVKRFLLPI